MLARKYRPATFDDLIGQDAMVTTLRNAFATDRIAQGYMLTGVRGVGKTTTARILSRALNYERDGVDQPTFDMAGYGRHCAEIMEGRHPDVLEMDAASNTGVDNIREIIESARYKPMVARYKVYLIDEVHMLSKGAFNALLKTLEEPPGHVKFIFATTEVRKVPLTVLSRCQRFDLRRVDVPVLIAHFKKIIANEGGEAEDEALALIARAAEGSVRDGLSLLDQALAMSAGKVERPARARHAGPRRPRPHLRSAREAAGRRDRRGARHVRPACTATAPSRPDPGRPGRGRAHRRRAPRRWARPRRARACRPRSGARAAALAERLSVAILARAWQMLLKGLEEIAGAPNPAAAAEMVLIRLAYTADLPAPDEIINALGGGAQRAGGRPALRPTSAEKRPAVGTPVDALDSRSRRGRGPARGRRRALPDRPRQRAADPAHVRRRGRRWPASAARPSSRCTWKST